MTTHVSNKVAEAELRKYDSSLSMALTSNNIPQSIYHQVISSANQHLATLHRYLNIRKKILKVDALHLFDLSVPLVIDESDEQFDIAKTQQLTLASAQPLGEEYTQRLLQIENSNLIDAYTRPNKVAGAYVLSIYDYPPFVLLNHNNSLSSVFTYAHEVGHAAHTLIANANQPFETFYYSSFVAELASTTNEILLQDYLIRNARSAKQRALYLEKAIDVIYGGFFRQAQFAEFELAMHETREKGKALSGSIISSIFLDIQKKYYGHAQGVTHVDDISAYQWAYLPHYYYHFYVYQYATSVAGATFIADRILAGDVEARDNYINLLKAGGSDYPNNLLKQNSIMLDSPKTYDALMQRMNKLLDELEQTMTEINSEQ